MQRAVGQYLTVTASYWAFTLTDGALRMLVVLYFHGLGYSPLEVAMLFLFYEFFGIVTNLVGGWLAARLGFNATLHMGLALQILALGMLLVDDSLLTVAYVMVAQALSGIAKDLNKMSAKGSIKLLVPGDQQARLYRWVAVLTGSKNALKGVGFFLGGFLLAVVGFRGALLAMMAMLTVTLIVGFVLLDRHTGKAAFQAEFRDIFSSSRAVNRLAAARLFLFGARDIWFVVALPVFLQSQLGWGHAQVGGLLAIWVVGYGFVQSQSPVLTGVARGRAVPDGATARRWALALLAVPAIIAALLFYQWGAPAPVLVVGLLMFGALFAVNSAVHSYLIIAYARNDGVSLDVGFYYMANAAGRLLGTVLSGAVFQVWGLEACLLASSLFLAVCFFISLSLPRTGVESSAEPG